MASYILNRDEWETHRGALFRHFFAETHSDSPEGSLRIETRKKFVSSYFNRFLRNGGESTDHFDMSRLKTDSYGIPQDICKRYFVMAQKEFPKAGYSLSQVPQWLVRHFEYVVQLSMDFENDCKMKKLRELRKAQRDLPIAERRQEIIDAVAKNQVLVIAGDTGCGKSTQVPQYLLSAGYSGIAVTQPRRLACTALARRVAHETLQAYGTEVAYQIRFESTKSKRTKLVFLTEGLLLRQMGSDSLLQQYSVIILDEVHERHISGDLLIGLLRDLVSSRPDIRLILMSATINLDLFKKFFPEAPSIQVPGRLFPIKLVYRPIKQFMEEKQKKNNKIDPEPFLRVLELIDKEVPSMERGDALIFLNGVSEITTVAETLKTYAEINKNWIIMMLHSTLSTDEQDRVFDVPPSGVRKCILSTNIAETSVTIDGIRFVIDSGKVNLMQYEAASGMQRLCEFWVSRASADQRKGRAGRTGPGTCYRLYSEEQYDKMDPFTLSEINRVSLQDMALQMLSLNLGLDVRTFPYIEKPNDDALSEAMEMLKFQGIVYSDRESHLTSLGNTVAKLPVSVPISKMLVFGCILDCVETALTVAGGLSIQSPFTNRSFRDLDVIERRSSLCMPMGGDPTTLISVFREWVREKCDGRSRRWAIDNGIDEHRLFEISKLRMQYRDILTECGLLEREVDAADTDSRQRRIERGEKRKLEEMKRDARNSERTRKVLKADRHFDSLLEDEEEDEKESNPLKADVRSVEFLLSHKHKTVDSILRTHTPSGRSRSTRVLCVAAMAGLYPNYAVLDHTNKYTQGQELYAHTRLKPFCQLHPNGVIPQYSPECLDAAADSSGFSRVHQIVFYGTLLETTKPYLCNILPMPLIFLTVVAKKVICEDWDTVIVDDFVTITFDKASDGIEVMREVTEIRRLLSSDLSHRLRGKITQPRALVRKIDNLFEKIMREGVLMSVNREVRPPRVLEDTCFCTPDGRLEEEEEEEEEEMNEEREEEERIEKEEPPVMDPYCPPTRNDQEDREEDAEIERKKEKKESYYEILMRKQMEKQ